MYLHTSNLQFPSSNCFSNWAAGLRNADLPLCWWHNMCLYLQKAAVKSLPPELGSTIGFCFIGLILPWPVVLLSALKTPARTNLCSSFATNRISQWGTCTSPVLALLQGNNNPCLLGTAMKPQPGMRAISDTSECFWLGYVLFCWHLPGLGATLLLLPHIFPRWLQDLAWRPSEGHHSDLFRWPHASLLSSMHHPSPALAAVEMPELPSMHYFSWLKEDNVQDKGTW